MSLEIALMGMAVGILVGLTGVGGASLLTPILMLIGIHPTVAVGTDLFYNSITKLFGSIQHYRQRTVNWKLVKYLALGSVPSAVLAVSLMQMIESFYKYQETIIKHSLGVVLIIAAIATIMKQFQRETKESAIKSKPIEAKRGLTIMIGAVLGFIVGLTSIGSGSLFALAMLYLFRLSAPELVGTDIAHAFLLVTAAGLFHAGFGHVDYMLAFNLMIGSVPGVILGSNFSARVPAKPLRTLLASLILISGLKLL